MTRATTRVTSAFSLALALALSAACSNSSERSTVTAPTNTPSPTASATTSTDGASNATPHSGSTTTGDAPAAVRAALADAQTITTQHKDLTPAQVASIERETGTKIKDTDHHSYLGFASGAGGARRQVGAATLVEADGKQIVLVYESRNGLPYIREARAEGIAANFLDQFKGKGHDDKLQLGQDLRTNGSDDATARAAADAIRQDTRVMQTLYGAAHTH